MPQRHKLERPLTKSAIKSKTPGNCLVFFCVKKSQLLLGFFLHLNNNYLDLILRWTRNF